jgi:hypothetical protein
VRGIGAALPGTSQDHFAAGGGAGPPGFMGLTLHFLSTALSTRLSSTLSTPEDRGPGQSWTGFAWSARATCLEPRPLEQRILVPGDQFNDLASVVAPQIRTPVFWPPGTKTRCPRLTPARGTLSRAAT